jgi:hypothetical protein
MDPISAVTVIEFAAHIASLDRLTGSAILVLPRPEDDVAALDDEAGELEVAGRTADGRVALCLFGDEAFTSDPDPTSIQRSPGALLFAANLAAG